MVVLQQELVSYHLQPHSYGHLHLPIQNTTEKQVSNFRFSSLSTFLPPYYPLLLTINALQPLLVLATRAPSVVAMGTWYCTPSSRRGPATPTGKGM